MRLDAGLPPSLNLSCSGSEAVRLRSCTALPGGAAAPAAPCLCRQSLTAMAGRGIWTGQHGGHVGS